MIKIKTIVVPVDGSAHANAAVDWASELAGKYQSRIVLIHALSEWVPNTVPEELRELERAENVRVTVRDLAQAAGERIVEAAAARARGHGASAVETVVEFGDPTQVVLDLVKRRGSELVVMGRRGLGRVSGLLLGSVSSKLLHLADCACLAVK